jgi:hypothetical protein
VSISSMTGRRGHDASMPHLQCSGLSFDGLCTRLQMDP